jgi:hypothetical protein
MDFLNIMFLLGYVIAFMFNIEDSIVTWYSFSVLLSFLNVLHYLRFFYIFRMTIDMIVAVFTAPSTLKFITIFSFFLLAFTFSNRMFGVKR